MSFFLLLFLHVHCDIPLLTVWLQIPYICIWPYHWIAIEYLLKPFPSIKVWKNQKYVKKKSTERLKTCFVKQKKGPKSAAAAFTALGWLFDFFTQGIYFLSTFRLFASCRFQNLKSSKSGQKVQKANWHICWCISDRENRSWHCLQEHFVFLTLPLHFLLGNLLVPLSGQGPLFLDAVPIGPVFSIGGCPQICKHGYGLFLHKSSFAQKLPLVGMFVRSRIRLNCLVWVTNEVSHEWLKGGEGKKKPEKTDNRGKKKTKEWRKQTGHRGSPATEGVRSGQKREWWHHHFAYSHVD